MVGKTVLFDWLKLDSQQITAGATCCGRVEDASIRMSDSRRKVFRSRAEKNLIGGFIRLVCKISTRSPFICLLCLFAVMQQYWPRPEIRANRDLRSVLIKAIDNLLIYKSPQGLSKAFRYHHTTNIWIKAQYHPAGILKIYFFVFVLFLPGDFESFCPRLLRK